jgi:hypothetical protein
MVTMMCLTGPSTPKTFLMFLTLQVFVIVVFVEALNIITTFTCDFISAFILTFALVFVLTFTFAFINILVFVGARPPTTLFNLVPQSVFRRRQLAPLVLSTVDDLLLFAVDDVMLSAVDNVMLSAVDDVMLSAVGDVVMWKRTARPLFLLEWSLS